MNNTLINNSKLNLDENTDKNSSLYNTFKSQKVKRNYYKNDSDLYFYSKIYFHLKANDDINIPFYNSNAINFSLIMTILMNDLFGNYEFYNSFIMQFMDPENTYYNLINIIYNSDNLKVKKFNLIFKQSLLQYKYCKKLFKIKSDFFNLDFTKKYSLVMFHDSKIKTICFLSSFLEIINLDQNYFLHNQMNVNFTGRNKYDSFLLKNYYFKNFININNIKELYTSFLNYENINNLKSNIKIKKETNFLFFEDLNNKLIVSKHADGCGVFSKKFNVSFKKHGNLMICFFRKTNDDIDLFTAKKYIPYVHDKKKIEHMKVPKSSLGDSISIKYDKANKTYNFYEINLKKGTFSNEDIKINLAYLLDKKMVIIVINDERIENLYYLLKGKNIVRFLKNSKKICRIAKFRKVNHDLVCDILQIILPFEYIIIQVILYFELDTQSGGMLGNMYRKMTGQPHKNVTNMDLEKKILKELGKPPGTDMKILSLLKKNKPNIIKNVKNTNKLLKQTNLTNIIPNLESVNESLNFKNNIYKENELLSTDLELYPEDDKNECFQNVVRDTDSWLFQYYFYKAKFNECEYYYDGFKDCFIEKKKEIERNRDNKKDIINKLNEIRKTTDSNNKKKENYINSLKEILEPGEYFNELLMMFQFNKNWLDNYYDLKKNNKN
jgi:hypothetical protein